MNFYSLDTVYFYRDDTGCNSPDSCWSEKSPEKMLEWFTKEMFEGDDYCWINDSHESDFILYGEGIANAIRIKKNHDKMIGDMGEYQYMIQEIEGKSILADKSILYMEYRDGCKSDGGRVYRFYRFRQLNEIEMECVCRKYFQTRHMLKQMSDNIQDTINMYKVKEF